MENLFVTVVLRRIRFVRRGVGLKAQGCQQRVRGVSPGSPGGLLLVECCGKRGHKADGVKLRQSRDRIAWQFGKCFDGIRMPVLKPLRMGVRKTQGTQFGQAMA